MTQKTDPRWLRTYWPLFVLLTPAVFFGVPQALGIIFPGVGGTLSEMTREWLGVQDGEATGRFWVFTVFWTALAVWFPVHLLKKWPWEKERQEP